mmetsp:Transcript_34681/g.64075  ORF Transcript_34681/g.64075 Transcript_34681/m.64075 type:complete len:216 (-) Transcript_34681:779-1426(-)
MKRLTLALALLTFALTHIALTAIQYGGGVGNVDNNDNNNNNNDNNDTQIRMSPRLSGQSLTAAQTKFIRDLYSNNHHYRQLRPEVQSQLQEQLQEQQQSQQQQQQTTSSTSSSTSSSSPSSPPSRRIRKEEGEEEPKSPKAQGRSEQVARAVVVRIQQQARQPEQVPCAVRVRQRQARSKQVASAVVVASARFQSEQHGGVSREGIEEQRMVEWE